MNELKERLLFEISEFEGKLFDLRKSEYLNYKRMYDIGKEIIELNNEINNLEYNKNKLLKRYDKVIAVLVSLVATVLLPMMTYKFLTFMSVQFAGTTSFMFKNICGIIMLLGGGLIIIGGSKLFGYISNKIIRLCSNMIINSSEYKKRYYEIENKRGQIEKLNLDKFNLEKDRVNIMFECSKYMASIKINKWVIDNINNKIFDNDMIDNNYENMDKNYCRKRIINSRKTGV